MAGFREREKEHFPLQQIQDVVDLFKEQLTDSEEPNLSLLSIVLGSIENVLTVNRSLTSNKDVSNCLEPIFPVVELETVEALYTKFVTLIKSSVDLSQYPGEFASRELVKKVSDIVWGSLTRAFYKDKAHLQSLYSFLTGNKLDCFGVAFAVVAAFQVLGYKDVHLALSEDHAWVLFGENLAQSAEVTWHGKGNEDKRGQPITHEVKHKSWLYLNGEPVVCTRQMEVAAIVSAINPSISASMDSVEMGSLQQELLWLLHDMGHLNKYPMALGNLGDLEEISKTPERSQPLDLFMEAIEAGQKNYSNQHVYPYTYLAAYMYRKGCYRDALQYWAEASAVIRNYNYKRDDEEIYKEFIEIANDLLPTMMKVIAADNASRLRQTSLLYDPESYRNFLRFYDGICEWEEDSPTPVLHITWAKNLVFSLAKFDPIVRKYIEIHKEGEEDDDDESDEDESEEEDEKEEKESNVNSVKNSHSKEGTKGKRGRKGKQKSQGEKLSENHDDTVSETETRGNKDTDGDVPDGSPKMNGKSDEEQIKSAIEELVSKVGEESQSEAPNPNIAALAQACSESILNPDYLLTGGEPFTTSATSTVAVSSTCDSRVDVGEFLSTKSNGSAFMGMTVDSMLKAESPADMMMFRKRPDSAQTQEYSPETNTNASESGPVETEEEEEEIEEEPPVPPRVYETVSLTLRSQKMKGLRKLLLARKLNTSAIMLQLTAQSQVHFKRNKRGSDLDFSLPRKRTRRE